MRDKQLRRRVRNVLDEDGPLSFEAVSDRIYGCSECGKVTSEEHDEVSAVIREMHRDGDVVYTVDRRVELES